MFSFLARAQRWWTRGQAPAEPQVPYVLCCPCGRTLNGTRQKKYQIARCEGCGRKLFVLPLSPLPPVLPEPARASGVAPRVAPPGRRRWWLPVVIVAVLVVLAGLVGFGLALRHRSPSPSSAELPSPATAMARIRSHVAVGRQSLAEGNFQLAAEQLEAAVALREEQRDLLPASESRHLTQLHRQAVLLADLLTESLEEILQRLRGQQERERQAAFARRYAGRAVVFDAQVWRDASGRHHLDYHLLDRGVPARVEIGALQLLRHLPLQDPQRLIFGARLAGIQWDPAGKWVVHFDRDSLVLLTDADAVSASCAQPIDEDLLEVLRRQGAWLADLP